MTVTAYGKSDVGLRRANNEDCFLIDEPLGLYMVCDGMGGHQCGEVASQEAARSVQSYLHERSDKLNELRRDSNVASAQDLVVKAIRYASQVVCDDAQQVGSDMGTTLTLLLTVGDRAVLASVGDSRAYHCRRDRAKQLTTDHTLANEMLISGQLTPEQARVSPFNHYLTRAVGRQKDVQVDTLVTHLVAGDVFLLCTDGLTNYFESDRDLGKFMFNEPANIPSELIAFANAAGGKDNITALVVHVGVGDGPPRWNWKSWFTRVA